MGIFKLEQRSKRGRIGREESVKSPCGEVLRHPTPQPGSCDYRPLACVLSLWEGAHPADD